MQGQQMAPNMTTAATGSTASNRSSSSIKPEVQNVVKLLRAIEKSDCASVEKMLKSGVLDPRMTDYDRRSPLHIAAYAGQADIVTALLKAGADPQALDRLGRTPLNVAKSVDAHGCIAVLKSANVEPSSQKSSGATVTQPPATKNVGNNKMKKMDKLASKMSLPGFVLLHACAHGDLSEVRTLLSHPGMNLNSEVDYDRRTALHLAATEGFLPVVKVLVDAGAKLDVKDRWGNTPIDDATHNRWHDVVSYLMSVDRSSVHPTTDIMTKHLNGATGIHNVELTVAGTTLESEHIDAAIHSPRNARIAAEMEDRTKRGMRALHARGVAERWALKGDEIKLQDKPFAKGSGGEDWYLAKWRKMTCVARSCGPIDTSTFEAVTGFGQQLNELSHLRHPNLVMFLGAVFTNDPPFLLLEHCAGGTLFDRVKPSPAGVKRLTRSQRHRIVWETALGMNCLHSCTPPVLHHDLKPSNVLLTDDLHAKITAFGLRSFKAHSCKITRARSNTPPDSLDKKTDSSDESSSSLNDVPHSHTHLGPGPKTQHARDEHRERYRFVAPEVFNGAQGDVKADVYAFGLVAFALMSGHLPFEKIACGWDAATAAAKGTRPNLAEVPAARRELLRKCWATDPSQRPTFEEIVSQLDPAPLGQPPAKTFSRAGTGAGAEKLGCVVS